jgi:arabinogalactan endo-1,4-beta-galactosidase
MKSLITFTYQSFALEDQDNLNIYVAPLAWQPIASDLEKITDSVYQFTYDVLDEYCSEGLIPEIVAIGGESTWHRLMPNVKEEDLPDYDPARSAALHNAGSQAVREIAAKFDTVIKVCFHMRGPATTKWWLEEHWPYGLDLDMIGISLYHGWNFDDYAGYSSLGDYVSAITNTYGIEFIVMETAQMFTEGGSDSHVDILGTDLIPYGYPNPPNTETQKQYLSDITREVLENGGSGVLVWGGEWVASDCYIYADQWGKGSSWENKAFWDFDYNLHEGVNWMMEFSEKVPVTFKVDMTGADTSNGVFVTGDFIHFSGESWEAHRMKPEGNQIYALTTYMDPGASGEYFFLKDTTVPIRETIPVECSEDTGINRVFIIPHDSQGEILAFRWSACEPVPQYQLATEVNGNGHVSATPGMYSAGIQVNLLATPALGWKFTGWSGDTISTENPLQVIMDANKQFTANFQLIPKVLVTFKVDMTGIDVTQGVYVTGDFPDMDGKTWQLNRMWWDVGNVYRYSTEIPVGTSGAYYFMNDDVWGVRESVPAACAEYWGVDRGYEIPLNSTGETFAFVWSSCDEIGTSSLEDPHTTPGSVWFESYPNPLINNQLNLFYHLDDHAEVSIWSMTGEILHISDHKTYQGDRHVLDVSFLPAGSYILQIHFKEKNLSKYHLILK